MTILATTYSTGRQSTARRTGVLLIHGLNGSLKDMAEIEIALRKHNFLTSNILLPGHGSTVQELVTLGWPEWSAAVHAEYQHLKQHCDKVFVIGHSLGGALALDLAAHKQVAGLVTMCAPLNLYAWLKPLIRAAKYVTPLVPTLREDVRDREARRAYTRDVYRWTPMRSVESMIDHLPTLREELPGITAPALVMVSNHDHVVPARDGREIYRLLGSHEKYLVTFFHSYHVIMRDHDREEVLAKTEAFLLRQALHVQRDPF
jgi:carboxylesterase